MHPRTLSSMNFSWGHKQPLVEKSHALAGRAESISVAPTHLVLGNPVRDPIPDGLEAAIFGLGCFWGAERLFWQLPGVYATSVGYAGGYTENPTYEEVCSGLTGHAEVVRVLFDPTQTSYANMVKAFFEGHDPTQYMRQGNDIGSQYRSIIITFNPAQYETALGMREAFGDQLARSAYGKPVTEIVSVDDLETSVPFFFAENYHQQYLAKNPNGYCGLGGTGVSCPVGLVS